MPRTVNRKAKESFLPRKHVVVAVTRYVDTQLRCAREYGVGVEIQAFSNPCRLGNEWVSEARRLAKRIAHIEGHIGCHGAFVDTIHHSLDPEVARVARMRYRQALEIAETLGAGYLVLHSQYNPLIKAPDYPQTYHKQSVKFWPELVEEAERRGIPIYLENMFEDSPQPLRRLADAFDSPYLKVCLDIAHVMLYSRLDVSEWIDSFGTHLRHLHLNDCSGVYDDHLPLGKGKLDLPRTIALLKQTRLPLTYAIENHKGAGTSLRYLGLRRA